METPTAESQQNLEPITVQTSMAAPLEQVWAAFTDPVAIMQWNAASPDWHTPRATNDLRVGGKFVYHMAARDGSVGFDFEGTYTAVDAPHLLAYTMPDGRRVTVTFTPSGTDTNVTEQFDPETVHSAELQRAGWQAILDSFKGYVEGR